MINLENNSFGNNLTALRKRADLDQTQLGDKIGISQKTISSWETGRSYPGLQNLSGLCDALNCTMVELLMLNASDIGKLSSDIIISSLNSMNINSLVEVRAFATKKISDYEDYKKIQLEKDALEAKLREYEKTLSYYQNLKGDTNEDA